MVCCAGRLAHAGACVIFFFNDPATTEIYTLSLHDALPILRDDGRGIEEVSGLVAEPRRAGEHGVPDGVRDAVRARRRSEEHTSELQSRQYLVCRLLLEKKYSRRPRRYGYVLIAYLACKALY